MSTSVLRVSHLLMLTTALDMTHLKELYMPKLIKDSQLVQDDAWQVIDDEQDIQDYSIISLPRWQENKEALLTHAQAGKLGVWIDSHENVDLIGDDSSSFTLIAVNFPVFTDGRGYSTARLLREIGRRRVGKECRSRWWREHEKKR